MGILVEVGLYVTLLAVALPFVAIAGILAYFETIDKGLWPAPIQWTAEVDDWVLRRWDQ